MRKVVLALMVSVLIMTLSGCVDIGTEVPSGTYEAGSEFGKTVYTFGENDCVSVEYVSMGHTLFQKEGTFSLGEDGGLITLSFDLTENDKLPEGLTSFSGTFSYKTGEMNEIYIGNVCYIKTSDES